MNRADAAAILQIDPTVSPEDARRAYQELFTEHQLRLTNAPTPALRNLYQARLRELDEARDVMLAQGPQDDSDLPLAEPKLPAATGPSWQPGGESATQPPAVRPPPVTPPPVTQPPTKLPPPPEAPKPERPKTPAPPAPGPERKIDGPGVPPKRGLVIGVVAAAVLGIGGYLALNRDPTGGATAKENVAADSVTALDSTIARTRANGLRRRILGGEKFEDVARSESDDSSTAPNGGDLGGGVPGRFVAEFERAIDAVQPGEISEPALTPFGYHLIKLDRRNGDTLYVRHILIRIRHSADQHRTFLRQHLKENLAIGKIEFARGAYEAANGALGVAEAFTSKLPAGYAEDSTISSLKTQIEALRTKINRACDAENKIAQQRNEGVKCTFTQGFHKVR